MLLCRRAYTLWQNDLRTRLSEQARAIELHNAYSRLAAGLDPALTGARHVADEIMAKLTTMFETLQQRAASSQSAELENVEDRLDSLRRFARLEAQYLAKAAPKPDAAYQDALLPRRARSRYHRLHPPYTVQLGRGGAR